MMTSAPTLIRTTRAHVQARNNKIMLHSRPLTRITAIPKKSCAVSSPSFTASSRRQSSTSSTNGAVNAQQPKDQNTTTTPQTSEAAAPQGTTTSTAQTNSPAKPSPPAAATTRKKETQAQLDEELQAKMRSLSDMREGGDAGLELENGQPVAMRRGVRENMFRGKGADDGKTGNAEWITIPFSRVFRDELLPKIAKGCYITL